MAFKSLATSGIVNFNKYQNALVGNVAYDPGGFDLISTTRLTGSQSSVTFDVTGLGDTYKHLQIRKIARADISDWSSHVRFNSDTGSNYAWHQIGGDGSSVFSSAGTSQAHMIVGKQPYTADSYNFTADIIDIVDAFNSNKNTTIRSLSGYAGSNNPVTIMRSGIWFNTTPLTSITVTQLNGNFVSGSRFSLYGIKG